MLPTSMEQAEQRRPTAKAPLRDFQTADRFRSGGNIADGRAWAVFGQVRRIRGGGSIILYAKRKN